MPNRNSSLVHSFAVAAILLLPLLSVVDGKSYNGQGKKDKIDHPTRSPIRVPNNPTMISFANSYGMTKPCLMLLSDMETGSKASWWCQLTGEDANNAGAEDGHTVRVKIEGLNNSPASKWKSGITNLFSADARIQGKLLLIPQSTNVKFHTQSGNINSQVDTVDIIKKTIVVRVKATQSETTSSIDELRSDVFGDENDQYNFKTQMAGCSVNRVIIEKATGTNINDGVVEIDVETTDNEITDYSKMEDICVSALETLFNTDDLRTVADLIMICQPPKVDFTYFSAYAYFNSPLSFYWDAYCTLPDLDMHEVGHNFGLGHASQQGSTYGDRSGIMGASIFQDEGEETRRCYNAAKNWQLGWFEENSINLDLVSNDWEGRLVGPANFQASNDANKNVLLKIAESYYIQFNYAAGFNAGSQEFINRVTIVKQIEDEEYSWIQAALREKEAYTIDIFDYGPITVEVIEINTNNFVDAYADVRVYNGIRAKCIETCCSEVNCGDDSSISTDKNSYTPGDEIKVSFTNNSPKAYDWIWIIDGADVDQFGQINKDWYNGALWLFTCGSDDCEGTPNSGELSFDSSNLEAGVYVAYYLWIDRHNVEIASSPFTVVGNGNTISPTEAPVPQFDLAMRTNKVSYSDNENIDISFTNPIPTLNDWVGIYSAEETVQKYALISHNYQLYKYACGSPQDCEDDVYEGVVTFPSANLDAGIYRAYLLFGDAYNVLTRSEEFTVRNTH